MGKGHPQYSSFKTGQSVLRRIFRKERQNIDKFKHKYSGPYVVERVNENNVSYLLKDPEDGQTFKAHHIHLKPWRNPPKYILNHLSHFPINREKLEGEEVCTTRTEVYNPFIPVIPDIAGYGNTGSDDDDDSNTTNSLLEVSNRVPVTVEINTPVVVDSRSPQLPDRSTVKDGDELEQIINPRTLLTTITEVTESSREERENEDESSSDQSESIDLDSILNEGKVMYNISETGAIMYNNVFNWEFSSITSANSSSSLSCVDFSDEEACGNCTSLMSLIEKLDQLCLISKTLLSQETSYHALSLAPAATVNTDENVENSSFPTINLSSLFRTKSLPNMADFSGFNSKDAISIRAGPDRLADRLREIAWGLADARDSILQHRKDSLDRVRETIEKGRNRMEEVRVVVDSNIDSQVKSPPFLRSRGRALELELVPARPVEYKRKKK